MAFISDPSVYGDSNHCCAGHLYENAFLNLQITFNVCLMIHAYFYLQCIPDWRTCCTCEWICSIRLEYHLSAYMCVCVCFEVGGSIPWEPSLTLTSIERVGMCLALMSSSSFSLSAACPALPIHWTRIVFHVY